MRTVRFAVIQLATALVCQSGIVAAGLGDPHLDRTPSALLLPRTATNEPSAPTVPSGPLFWTFARFGSGIGGSNIVVVPGSGGVAPEIVIGGQSDGNYGADDFWQVVRRNPANGNYDQIFVTPLYPSPIRRIALGDVVGDARQEIVVLLNNGLIYFYDAVTKSQTGSFNIGANGAEGLSLTDLMATDALS